MYFPLRASRLVLLGFLASVACLHAASEVSDRWPTKEQWIRKFGPPARVTLYEPSQYAEPEVWYYYYQGADGKVREAAIAFQNGRVSSFGYFPDRGEILSPDRPGDLAKIRDYLSHAHSRR